MIGSVCYIIKQYGTSVFRGVDSTQCNVMSPSHIKCSFSHTSRRNEAGGLLLCFIEPLFVDRVGCRDYC